MNFNSTGEISKFEALITVTSSLTSANSFEFLLHVKNFFKKILNQYPKFRVKHKKSYSSFFSNNRKSIRVSIYYTLRSLSRWCVSNLQRWYCKIHLDSKSSVKTSGVGKLHFMYLVFFMISGCKKYFFKGQ